MRTGILALTLAASALSITACAQTPTPRPGSSKEATFVSPRPQERINATPKGAAGFDDWYAGFARRAEAQGIRPATLAAAFSGATYQPDVIRLDRNQSEFTKQLWEYLDSAVSGSRIDGGRRAIGTYGPALQQIESRYGVDSSVVVAIWGLESAYGSNRGSTSVIPALATLAYDGRRGDFFEAELIAALKILQAGDTTPSGLRGSWAGAMGHTQFMPSSYLDHAVDFTGDGRRDIWSDDPTDALASTAAYLSRRGWQTGQPWGVEVRLPQGFDYAAAGHESHRSVASWTSAGVRDMAGNRVPNYGDAAILIPAGARGPAFMVFKNFDVIKTYNSSDSYAIAVGHLSDRIRGAGPFQAGWPRGDRALAFSEKKELQERLTAKGFDTAGIDGRLGPDTIRAIRSYQIASGLTPDGYATPALLQQLR